MPKLTFILDDGQEIVVALGECVTIGRRDGNDVIVDDIRVAGRHAEIVLGKDGGFEVRDLGSKTGTFVNGVKVAQAHSLRSGDKLVFGALTAVIEFPEPSPIKAIQAN